MMFENSKYISSSIVVAFNRQRDIRRKQFEMEDALQGLYGQPKVVSVPDDLDPEMPRLIFASTNGYSQIVASQLNISLNVRYSQDEWQENIEKGKEYLLERIPLLFKLLSCVNSDLKVNFCGFNTKVYLPYKAKEESMIKGIEEKYLSSSQQTENVYEIIVKISRVVQKQFFSNIKVTNYKIWEAGEDSILVNSRIGLVPVIEKGLEVFMDYNDRYSFNHKQDYYSKKEKMIKILKSGLKELEEEIKRIRG